MINANEKFCDNQGNPAQCLHCVSNFHNSERRRKYLLKTASVADRILYPSSYFKSLHERWGFPGGKSFVNRNGVTLPSENFKKRSGEQLTFGFIGGSGPIKGGDLIQKAFQEIEDNSYELIVVDAAKKIDQSWVDLNRWRIPGKLTVHPPYVQSDMDDFYSKIDVLLFPSKWKESFGLAVREALCRDVWVITTDKGGVIEDSRHGVNATLIPMSDNHLPLKAAILDALSKRESLKKYVNRHKNEVRSYADQSQELVGHYKDLLKTS
jgi:glycosyltransferase involved in cell wall biosynthesis